MTNSEQLRELFGTTEQLTVQPLSVHGAIDYYRATESLLYNYKRLRELAKREFDNATISENAAKAEGIELPEEVLTTRAVEYEQIRKNFREVKKVIDLFKHMREFVVIRMYYFGENADGTERAAGSERPTFEDITAECSERGILSSEKTARKWRSRLVRDIAVCMFGRDAALDMNRNRFDYAAYNIDQNRAEIETN